MGEASFLNDIAMENKGLEYSQYMPKESLAQQGGFALTNKGPQHDEAWLIFMDMVNNQIPTFENKAEALHYFPMFRTWFGLVACASFHGMMLNQSPTPSLMNPQKYLNMLIIT